MQTERVRKMLLAFSRDLRVVLLRLASRLQTLRWHASSRTPCPPELARESQQVFAPLANRLGIWQIKWELEDLSFRFLEPDEYRRVARLLDERRVEREAGIVAFRTQLVDDAGRGRHPRRHPGPAQAHLQHLEEDARQGAGLRPRVRHPRGARDRRRRGGLLRGAEPRQRALPRGRRRVRRLHRAAQGQRLPVAAHGREGRRRPRVRGADPHARDARARRARRRRALGLQGGRHQGLRGRQRRGRVRGPGRGRAQGGAAPAARVGARLRRRARSAGARRPTRHRPPTRRPSRTASTSSRPQASVIELPAGGTPVDFAYSLHTDVGHRCRGARVDGAMVPLQTPLQNGQTVEIVTVREGGPSMDWLNPELHFLQSPRARAKVRAWFNALQHDADRGQGPRAGGKAAAARGPHGDQPRGAGRQAGLRRRRRRCSR